MAPASCSLDDHELHKQLARYRSVGEGATVIERAPRRIVIAVSDVVPDAVIAELVAVENDCCPFFELDWQPAVRQLMVGVPDGEHEPALEAIAFALGLTPASA